MSAPGRDDEPDAWLRQALRHAPDAQAAPPSALSESILAKARAAAAPPSRGQRRRRSLADVLLSAWSALARPPVAAGFASVMAATIVGLMWWDRPMDEALPRPPSSAPAPRIESLEPPPMLGSTPAPSGAQAPSATPAPTPSSIDASPASPKPAPSPSLARRSEAPSAFPTPEVRREGARDWIDEAKKDRAPSLSTGPLGDAHTADAATSTAPARPAQTAAVPAPVPAPTPAPAPAPAAAPLDAGRAVGQLRSEVAADRAEKALAKSAPPPAEPAPAGLASRQRNAAESRAGAEGVERERPAVPTSPLTVPLDAIAREPQRWSRLSSSGAAVALDAAWREWLADVDAAGAGRWRLAPSNADARASAIGDDEEDPAPVQLFVDGRLAATLRLAGRTVRVDRSIGEARERSQASLAPDAARHLAAARARLPP